MVLLFHSSSMVFAPALREQARQFRLQHLHKPLPTHEQGEANHTRYLALHLRRRDFLFNYRKAVKPIDVMIPQVFVVSICLSVSLSIYLSLYLSIHLSIYLSTYLPTYLSIYV